MNILQNIQEALTPNKKALGAAAGGALVGQQVQKYGTVDKAFSVNVDRAKRIGGNVQAGLKDVAPTAPKVATKFKGSEHQLASGHTGFDSAVAAEASKHKPGTIAQSIHKQLFNNTPVGKSTVTPSGEAITKTVHNSKPRPKLGSDNKQSLVAGIGKVINKGAAAKDMMG